MLKNNHRGFRLKSSLVEIHSVCDGVALGSCRFCAAAAIRCCGLTLTCLRHKSVRYRSDAMLESPVSPLTKPGADMTTGLRTGPVAGSQSAAEASPSSAKAGLIRSGGNRARSKVQNHPPPEVQDDVAAHGLASHLRCLVEAPLEVF